MDTLTETRESPKLDFSKFQHAYKHRNSRVAMCGYDATGAILNIPDNPCPKCIEIIEKERAGNYIKVD